MVIKVGAFGGKKLFEDLLLPSWFSGFCSVTTSLFIIGITVVLTRLGSSVQQSILGLQHVYSQSSVGTTVQTVGDNFASNTYLNNALLFLLWGSVGLMVYSVVQGMLSEIKRADLLIQELHYVNADRRRIMGEAAVRETIKIVAFVSWWLVFRYFIYRLAPYAISLAHASAIHPAAISDWLRCLLAGFFCMAAVHLLTILMRLSVLRARVFGEEIEE